MTSLNGLPTITTFTGKLFNFLEPDPDSICIEDIAHGLAYENRFANQGICHYSVAQHSLLVEQNVPFSGKWKRSVADVVKLRLIALLHDATEAYLGDMAKPLKRVIPQYQAIEEKVHRAIAKRFKLASSVMPASVKAADAQLFANEWASFMRPLGSDAKLPFDPAIGVIQAWSAEMSEIRFLKRFKELFGDNA